MDPRAGSRAICTGAFILVGSVAAIAYIGLDVPGKLSCVESSKPNRWLILIMKLFNRLLASLVTASSVLQSCRAQSGTPVAYTDSETGITFDTWTVPASSGTGGFVFGVALPSTALTEDATDFIGYLNCKAEDASAAGWCGVSFSSSMTSSLLLVAYPYEDSVLTSLRFGSGYSMPDVYTGDANITQISSSVNETNFELLFHCKNCLVWDQNGQTGNATTSKGRLVLGWAQASSDVESPSCPDDISLQQHDTQGIIAGTLDENAVSESYEEWVKLANKTVPGECSGDGGSGPTPVPVPDGATYDYIVVGGGAGGIPVADRLSEAGHSVLLIEKGPDSSGRWGGDMKPEWLDGTNLTRFDVPGLCNEIWVNSAGIACKDTDQMAGCVLGGGTAVNAGLWWKPNPVDWDYNFPEGWQSSDMQAAAERVFARIPGSDHPSTDGKRYYQQGFEVLSRGLQSAGWKSAELNTVPAQKNKTFGHAPFMFSGGERGGPMATYLVSASERKNFVRWSNTTVKRVVREGSTVTGVEVEASLDGGYAGTVNVTSGTGRVILSAGTFGSPKILMRSGIGPKDQLAIVKKSDDGETMIAESEWIELPVGHNLVDHVNTDLVFTNPDVVFYDFKSAYDDPIESDAQSYLNGRTGILAQAAPNIGPIIFDEVTGTDGVTRQIQWTARVEGGHDTPDGHAMTVSQYLGRGSTSRGRMTITSGLNTVVSTIPQLRDQADVDAVIKGIQNLQQALRGANLTWTYPAKNTTVVDFVNNMPVTTSARTANHWMGTCKIGTDDGRDGGSAVVDLDTKVYGTDNLFVVDASIFPGMITTNPSAYIVTVAERAAERILDLQVEEECEA
ncbi:hypothetical protein BDV25DRAFT_147246 [Aspergillus avenaceus]|uniref:Glucose-methanol-choline oxidoreductase N-terminal domain-containing protein n=1 Tax=Aspergillus avenaceus TaxID=36643 RepID=A0A5N6U7V6_ASPAV|nr:hypothetical protein BDV25DRAFT_147246 [Aspergillus avenaceus]